MSASKIKDKILRYGRDEDWGKLEALVQNQAPADLISLVRSSVCSKEGTAVLLYTMKGLFTKPETESTRLAVIKCASEQIIKTNSVPASDVKTFVEELQNGIRCLGRESLPEIVDFLTRQVEDLSERRGDGEDEGDLDWISLITPLLEEIKDLDFITPKDHHIEITGPEFRQRIISSLCETRWTPRLSIAMCQMFQDARLSTSETEEVFSKLNTVLNRTAITDLPPLFHHLLKLLKGHTGCSGRLVTSITQYFISKLTLAEREEDNLNSMESSDLIQSEHSSEEVQQTECLIIYYITQAAKMGHPVAKEIGKIARSSVNFPGIILNPFSLFSCLALTSVKDLSNGLIESLKATISKGYSIEESRQGSVWFRENTPPIPDISGLFFLVISQSVRFGGWDLIGQGLLDLSLLLLDTQPPLGKMNNKTRSLHNLAANILAKVIKKHSSSAQIIIPKLQDRIIVNSKSPQYTGALRIIIKEATTYLMEDNNTACIINFINSVHKLAYFSGRASLSALMPLLKLNRSLRNPLILVLRKSLFSKNVHTRQVGVSGVFTLLKTFKISSGMASSQNLSQSSGSLSQFSLDIQRSGGANNESLCTELLGVLKRCFSLQPKVKMLFYEGMSDVVSKNPELCEGLLELLHGHVLEVFGGAEDNELGRTGLDLGKTISEKSGQWVIVEPAGWFLHCIQTLVSRGQHLYSGGDCAVLDKLACFLDNLLEYYTNCEIGDLGFDPSDNYDRKTVEGRKRALKVDVVITVYEALMEYVMSHQAEKNADKASQLVKLCHRYISIKHLLEASKANKKPGGAKKDKVKKEVGEEGKEAQGSQAERAKASQAEKGVKRTVEGKEKELEDYVMETGAFSLRCISFFLQAVLEDRKPDNQQALTRLREDTSFFAILETILQTLLERYSGLMSVTGDEGAHSDNIFKPLLTITAVLFRHSVTCREPVQDFLQPGSQILLNYVKMVLAQFPERKLEFACALNDTSARQQSIQQLNTLLIKSLDKLMMKMSELRDQLDSDDESGGRLTSLAGVYTLVINQLNGDKALDGPSEAVKKLCEDLNTEDNNLCRTIVRLAFQSSLRIKFYVPLCPRTARHLHYIYGDLDTSREVEASKNLGYLSTETSEVVLPVMIEHMDACVDYADQAITWLKSFGGQSNPQAGVNLSDVELAITEQLAKMVTPSLELVNTALPAGPLSDVCLKFICKLYRILGNLANYFFMRTRFSKSCLASSKMDKLVKMVGTQLTPNVYSLITYVRKKFKEQEEEAKEARVRRNKTLDPNIARAKVLKETKEIPNLIFQIETFEKNMAKVGKRVNQKFEFKLPTSRDFRIKLTEDQKRELQPESESEDESSDESDSESQRSNASVLNQSDQNRSLAADGEAPSAKKSKLSSKLSKMKENKAA